MTNTKHTPGPWIDLDWDDISDEIVISGYDGEYVCSIDCDGQYDDIAWPTIRSNAHLIAAAPELLEALDQLVIEYDEADLAHDEPTSLTSAVNAARAAIAKAKGGTT